MSPAPARGGLDAASLRRVIGERRLGDWVITDRNRHCWSCALHGTTQRWRHEERAEVQVLVRRDSPGGRGTGVALARDRRGDPRSLIGLAVARAEAAIGVPWSTPPPAAIAKVALFDDSLAGEAAAEALLTEARARAAAAGAELAAAEVQLCRDELTLVSAQGFSLSWRESKLELSAEVARGDRRAFVRRAARRAAELGLAEAIAHAALRCAPVNKPAPVPSGPVHLELTAEAMLGADELGVWRAVTAQVDAAAARRGLTRHQSGAVLGLADAPLDVWSNGVLPFGLESAPVGSEGEAVRRFPLVAGGKLAELGLGPMEAALRRRAPNGGVRNLEVAVGAGEAARAPTLVVHDLADLTIDPMTGTAEGELGYAIDEQGRVLEHGGFSIELVHALATAERAREPVRRGAYLGPRWLRFGPVALRG